MAQISEASPEDDIMRYVSTKCIKEGMTLARNLYSKDQSLLLGQGQVIRKSYIEKIKKLGYSGVFIFDNISDEIEIESVISDQLKMSAVSAVKDVFITPADSPAVGTCLIENTKKIVEDLIDEIIINRNLMVNMVDLKVFDDYTFYHSVNVAVLSIIVGLSLDYPRSALYNLGLAALLHDIGKIFISKDILIKKGPLTEEEFKIIRKHPKLGYEYLISHFDIPPESYFGALQHHERYDGSGYPSKLKGENISNIGRIIAIADVYDSLTSDRPYRKALLPSDAMEYIMGGSSTMFDPLYVQKFTRKVAAFPLGTIVKLSDGSCGIVVKNYEDCSTRPCVRIIDDDGEQLSSRYVDLHDDYSSTNLTIIGIEK
jgi:HD-GYP domain-containing protein (c-di-GMP phosphodiesterase class II)